MLEPTGDSLAFLGCLGLRISRPPLFLPAMRGLLGSWGVAVVPAVLPAPRCRSLDSTPSRTRASGYSKPSAPASRRTASRLTASRPHQRAVSQEALSACTGSAQVAPAESGQHSAPPPRQTDPAPTLSPSPRRRHDQPRPRP